MLAGTLILTLAGCASREPSQRETSAKSIRPLAEEGRYYDPMSRGFDTHPPYGSHRIGANL